MFFIDFVALDLIISTTLLGSSIEFLGDVLFDILGALHSPETRFTDDDDSPFSCTLSIAGGMKVALILFLFTLKRSLG